MPYCRCGSEFSEARARLGFDCCLECGGNEAAAEAARHACMIDRPDKPQIRLHLSGNRSDDGAADAAGTGPIRKNRPMIRSSHDSSLEEAVRSEPVSEKPNSLFFRENTGNFIVYGPASEDLRRTRQSESIAYA